MRQATLFFCLFLLAIIGPRSAFSQNNKALMRKMPAGANAVMVVDVRDIRESSADRTKNRFDSHADKMDSGVGFLPAGTNTVLLASQMNLGSLSPTWTSGWLKMPSAPSLQSVAQRIDGTIDNVAGRDVLATPSGRFVFKLDERTLGTLSPPNRQNLANWLTSLKSGRSNAISEYLADAVGVADNGADFVMAFDLAYVVSPKLVLERAKESTLLKQQRIDPRKFSDLVGSVRGVTITATMQDGINASATIDFGADARILAPVAKQLILEFTTNHGVHIAEIEKWKAAVDGKRVTYGGEFSKNGLRRLISLFDSPAHQLTATAQSPAPSSQEPKLDPKAVASRQYFDSVSSMFNELRKDIGPGGASTYQYQRWANSYADKIDQLPIRNVDSDLLDFGGFVSKSLRGVSLKVTDTHQTADVRNANHMAYRYGYGYGYGYGTGYGYGGYGYRYGNPRLRQAQADRRAVHQKARSSAITFGASAFTDIADRETDVRRLMAEKYPDAF